MERYGTPAYIRRLPIRSRYGAVGKTSGSRLWPVLPPAMRRKSLRQVPRAPANFTSTLEKSRLQVARLRNQPVIKRCAVGCSGQPCAPNVCFRRQTQNCNFSGSISGNGAGLPIVDASSHVVRYLLARLTALGGSRPPNVLQSKARRCSPDLSQSYAKHSCLSVLATVQA